MVEGWSNLTFWKNTWPQVQDYLSMRIKAGARVYPDEALIFKALEKTSFDNVKVVLLGQDPYHTQGMAHGLAFSVPASVKNYPPSLRNIIAEYCDDLGFRPPRSGDLTEWAEKGVLLLNTALTVEEGKPLSHANIGWGLLTYEIIRSLSEKEDPIAFMLWGKKAQEYAGGIDSSKHIVQYRPHPSPLSRGYRGSKPFSDVANLLGCDKEFWRLP